jgi:hypothetical protein
VRPKLASRPVASVAIHRVTGGCEAYTARKQAVKVQLRNLTSLRCRRRLSSGRQHPGTTAIAMDVPGSPESPAQGMFPKGFPMNPGELAISARKSGKTAAKGDRRRPRTDGRAVLRPHITCEGGEPQGFRKERPRYPLEGRGEQADESVERKHSRGTDLGRYVHTNRQANRPGHDGLGAGRGVTPEEPTAGNLHGGVCEGGDVSEAMVALNAHAAGNGG